MNYGFKDLAISLLCGLGILIGTFILSYFGMSFLFKHLVIAKVLFMSYCFLIGVLIGEMIRGFYGN